MIRFQMRVYVVRTDASITPDEFAELRSLALYKLVGALGGSEFRVDDGEVVLPNTSAKDMVPVIRSLKASHGLTYEVAAEPVYSSAELENALFVRLRLTGEEIDRDRGAAENTFSSVVCDECRTPDFGSVTRPLLVRRPKRSNGYWMFNAANGFRVITRSLWERLEPLVAGDVATGPVAFFDTPDKITNALLWLRPCDFIGKYLDSRTLATCAKCGRPREIRGMFEGNPFLRGIASVDGLAAGASIALVGNWFGLLQRHKPVRVSWDMAVSGKVWAELRKLRVRGVCEGQVFHTRQELERLKPSIEELTDLLQEHEKNYDF